MKCKICQSESPKFATAKILYQYNIDYFQCSHCGFIQTEAPYWLDRAYQTPITASDYGILARNISLAKLTANVILNAFDRQKKFLDYGAGYGLFIRLMRDINFEFYGYDKYCQSLFPDLMLTEFNDRYELVTAFEVFEHLVDPLRDIEEILQFSHSILLSTEIVPCLHPKPEEWGYYVLHEGQHISFYTVESLKIIAKKFGLNLYTDGQFLHLLTDKILPENCAQSLDFQYYRQVYPVLRKTLLEDIQTNRLTEPSKVERDSSIKKLKILVDGVFFQLYRTGIARVWESIFREWVKTGFAEYITVLDRGGTTPRIAGISYRKIPFHDYNDLEGDRQILQQICDEENASLFISSYYTTPISTSSVFMAYDMIPEALGANLSEPMWREKHSAIEHAISFLAISENTKQDLVQFFPNIDPNLVTVAHCGIDPLFTPASESEVRDFKQKYGIQKPYFLLVAPGKGYKNAPFFFQGFSQLSTRFGFDLVCTGNQGFLEEELRQYVPGNIIYTLQLSDAELRLAYSGAISLVYPSHYEGFGLPVLEAIACGCPVITTPNASIPEVTGDAAIYVNTGNIDEMANALCEIQKPNVRNSLIALGLQQAKKFNWSKMAKTMSLALVNASLLPLNLQEINWIAFPDWSRSEEVLGEMLSELLQKLASHRDRDKITLLFYFQDETKSSPWWLIYFLRWTITSKIHNLMRYTLYKIVSSSYLTEEEVNLLLSGIALNLLMSQGLDLQEGTTISFVQPMAEIQWELLFSKLQQRIILPAENKEAIRNLKADFLPASPLVKL